MVTRVVVRIRSLIRAVAVAAGGFFVGILLISLAGSVLGSVGIEVPQAPGVQLFLSTVLLQGVAFGGVALAYIKLRDLEEDFVRARVPTRTDLVWLLGGSIVFLVLYGVLSIVISALGLPVAENTIKHLARQTPEVFLLLVPLSILLVGPGEELLFRGMVQGLLRQGYGAAGAILLASAIFAVSHASSLRGPGQFTYMAIVFILALVLGVTYERTGNLVVPALIHGTYNAVLFGATYVTIS